MSPIPSEVSQIHTRLLKCALEIDDCRAYWRHTDGSLVPPPAQVFERYWFGARSLDRVLVLLANLRLRFDPYPAALAVLHRWPDMAPDTRRLICHWHLQLADPLYRTFTGEFLPERRLGLRPEITRDRVVAWVGAQGPGRWTLSTRIQFASKLLSAAYSAGLVQTNRDPRPLGTPRVPDEALEYLVYLLRETTFEGTLTKNPYTTSVGLSDIGLEDRLRTLPMLQFRRQGDLLDFGWQAPSLAAWAVERLAPAQGDSSVNPA